MSDAGYKPSPWGTLYHNLPYWEVLGAGSAGPGKTTTLLADPLPQIQVEHIRCTYRGEELQEKLFALGIPREFRISHELPLVRSRDCHLKWGESKGWAVHIRRTIKNLEQSISKTQKMLTAIDSGAKWVEAKNTIQMSSGFKFQFGHCKDKNSWMDYMSNEYTHEGFDELVTFLEEQYQQISTRVRTDDPILMLMLKIRAMSNPTMTMESDDSFVVDDPFWVRRYFVDPAPEGKVVLEREVEMDDGSTETVQRMYLPATIDDNPNKAFVKRYKINLSSRPKHIREALLYGNWYYTPDAYYGEFWNERLHTCLPFRIPNHWPVFRSMDWGFKHYGCVHWWTIDDDGNLYCIREYFFIGKRDEEVAKEIRHIEEAMGFWRNGKSALTGPADTQLWQDLGGTGRTMAQTFHKMGIHWQKCDKGNQKHFRQQRNAEMLLGRLKDHKDGTVTPGIVFFRSCPQIIRAIPSIQTDSKNTAVPRDTGDSSHAHDSCLYACAYASRGRRGVAKVSRSKEPWEDEDRRVTKRSIGNYGSVA